MQQSEISGVAPAVAAQTARCKALFLAQSAPQAVWWLGSALQTRCGDSTSSDFQMDLQLNKS